MKLEELGLSGYAYNGLKRNGISTVDELRGKTREELMQLRGIGWKSAREIARKVEKAKYTNGDCIRAMTDEELAKFLRWDICSKVRLDNRKCYGDCDDCVIDWLRQPAGKHEA